MLKSKFLLKIFLFLFSLIILGSWFGLVFFFSRPADTIINFVPENALIYFHLSFSPLRSVSRQASIFFQKNWPVKTVNFLFSQPSWQTLKPYFAPEIIASLRELGLVLYQKNDEIFPLLIYRFKPDFNHLVPVFNRQVEINQVYPFWLSSDLVILSPEKIDLLELIGQAKFLPADELSRPLISQSFAQIYLNLPKIETITKESFKNYLEENFSLYQTSQSKIGYLEVFLKEKDVFFLESYASKNSIPPLFKKNEKIAEFFPFQPDLEYFLLYSKEESLVEKNLSNFIGLKIFERFSPKTVLLSREGIIFITKKPAGFSWPSWETTLRDKLSYCFPQEKKILLPDNSFITEIKADPEIFKFEWQILDGFKMAELKTETETLDLATAYNDNFLLFGQGLDFFKSILKTFQRPAPDLLTKKCLSKDPAQVLIFSSKNKGLFLIISKDDRAPNNPILRGCLKLE